MTLRDMAKVKGRMGEQRGKEEMEQMGKTKVIGEGQRVTGPLGKGGICYPSSHCLEWHM